MLKHCYTPTKLISDDHYRTRRDCHICKKSFYTIKDHTVKTGSAGTLTLLSGVPFINCGWCDQPVRLHDASKIRIFVKFEEIGQEYARIQSYDHLPALPGDRYVTSSWRPVIRTALGCVGCHHLQSLAGSRHCFNQIERPQQVVALPPDTTIYRERPATGTVVASGIFPSAEGAKTQQCWSPEPLTLDDLPAVLNPQPNRKPISQPKGLNGPYNDRTRR